MLKVLLEDGKTFLALLSIACFLFFLDLYNFLSLPKSLAQTITSPIQYGLYKTGKNIGRQFEFIVLARYSAQQNKALTEQLFFVLSENANLRRKLAETEGMLLQQNSLNPQTFNMVPARPVGLSRYLFIDKGSEDGISLNQAVVYKDNFIGKVTRVSPKQSAVLLPTDPDSKISAFVQNKDGRARGILRGNFGSEMLMDKVLHETPISMGDLVYTEGIETSLPRGLIMGTVSEVIEQQNEVVKQAKVRSMFEITNLDILFVITN